MSEHHGRRTLQPEVGRVLVVCDANVCRSVYAAVIIGEGLSSYRVHVRSAGTHADDGLRPCGRVWLRCQREGLAVPFRQSSHRYSREEIEAADLILVMTQLQEAEITRTCPEARSRTMSLIHAVLVAEANAERGVKAPSLAEWVLELGRARSRTPIPSVATPRSLRGLFTRSAPVLLSLDIADGHVSANELDHERTLDEVAEYSRRLVAAYRRSTQVLGHSPATPQDADPGPS